MRVLALRGCMAGHTWYDRRDRCPDCNRRGWQAILIVNSGIDVGIPGRLLEYPHWRAYPPPPFDIAAER